MESSTQGSRPRTQKNSKPRTALPRTDRLEAKDSDARGHDQGPRAQAQVFSEKKIFKIFFQAFFNREKQKTPFQIFRLVSRVFLHNFKNEQIPAIVETDANAHHTIWGSSDVNPRGEDLLACCVSADLNFCNVGKDPTFRTKTREEVLHLNLGEPVCVGLSNWLAC